MRSRRTPIHGQVLGLPGGTEDNDLFVRVERATHLDPRDPCYAWPMLSSAWEPDPAERAAIAAGALVELTCLGTNHPPVQVGVTRALPLSRPTTAATLAEEGADVLVDGQEDGQPRLWMELPQELAQDLVDLITAEVGRPHGRMAVPDAQAFLERMGRLGSLRDTLARGLAAVAQGWGQVDQGSIPDTPPEWLGGPEAGGDA